MPLSISTVIQYTYPIFISIFAGIFINEKITRNVIFALIIGWIGILVILNPTQLSKINVEIENVDKNISINTRLIYLLLISLLGGFILNLMPCVFPVLSLKLLSVINTEDKKIKSSFFITVLGIITSFLILGAFFAILKQINISISWGMQFQEPYFLMFILIIISMFFLNTLGLFQINLPSFLYSSKILNSGNNFYTKNFFNGFFATLLATPCSAPYLGTAVTAAFTQSTTYLFLIFCFMGIGMSYLI